MSGRRQARGAASVDRRNFLKSSAGSALLASMAGFGRSAPGAELHGPAAPRGFENAFTRDEYAARWARVQQAMATAGYDNLVVWQRSAGTYDKVGDVYWLTNFQTNGTGQDPATDATGAPWTFSAVLFRKGQEPELHVGLTEEYLDRPNIVCGKLVMHEPNMMVKFAEYLRSAGIEGRVAVVGDDILPGMSDRLLRRHTPQIEWVADYQLLEGPQLIKSPREIEIHRAAGALVSNALDAAMKAMISGERSCEAAARAASVLMAGGGGFHRISINHGPMMEDGLSKAYYGYDTRAPNPGDLVTVWIYGPILAGYWLDPGRTAVCGSRQTPAQKSLIEDCANYVGKMVKVIAPGMSPRDLGIRWAEIEREGAYFDGSKPDSGNSGHGFGHGLATSFPGFILPVGDEEVGLFGYRRLQQPLKPGMVLAAEAFLSRPGVGTAGFENNFIVTDTGAELLDTSPMLYG
jgi:Xaa-Pro aminopeptidase